jgi:hypothetical protein
MWFNFFVLLRIPISLVCLLGYALAVGPPGAVFFLGAFAFLAANQALAEARDRLHLMRV